MNFKERLKELRIENGYTQPQIAEYLQITTRSYQRYEQGTMEPSIEKIIHLGKLFQVSIDYLLGVSNSRKR